LGKLLQCSEAEREACEELRAKLASAGPGARDPITMLRFLRARQGDVEAAAKMYAKSREWHKKNQWEIGFRKNLINDEVHKHVDAYYPPSAIMGRDYDGDVVYWIRFGLSPLGFLSQAPMEFLERHETYSITRILQAMEEYTRKSRQPRMYMTVVVELTGIGPKFLNVTFLRKYKRLARIMEDNYPEMIKRVVVVNAPTVAYHGFNIVTSFFDEGTRRKIKLADNRRTFETLRQFIDPVWIPEALGGLNRIGSDSWCEPQIPKPPEIIPQELIDAVEASCSSVRPYARDASDG